MSTVVIIIESVHVESMTIRMNHLGNLATLQSSVPTVPHVRGQLLGLLESVTNGFTPTGKRVGDIPDAQLGLYFDFRFSDDALNSMATSIRNKCNLEYTGILSDLVDNFNGSRTESFRLAAEVLARSLGRKGQVQSPVDHLLNNLFNKELRWDTDAQGIFAYEGLVESVEVNLRASHTLGNFFINGRIGDLEVRIFVTGNILVHVRYPYMNGVYHENPDETIHRDNRDKLAESINSLIDWNVRERAGKHVKG